MSPKTAAYELVQATQALHQLDSSVADIEPLTQDPTLLTTMDPLQLAAAMQNCTMLDVSSQALISGYKDGLQAAAGTLHVSTNVDAERKANSNLSSLQASGASLQLQYAFPPSSPGNLSGSILVDGNNQPVAAFGHQLLLQSSQFRESKNECK
jgi:hypothetical protein